MSDHDNVIPFPQRRPPRGPEGPRPEADEPPSPPGRGATVSPIGEAREPRLLVRRATPATYTVRIDLADAIPAIWRRIEIASDLTLDQVHEVVQSAMGWSDSHLHTFRTGPDPADGRQPAFLTDWDVQEGEDNGLPETAVHLDQVLGAPGDRLLYDYDFGDGWSHTLRLERVSAAGDGPATRCLAGRRACPPENVGGMHYYNEVVATLAGRQEPDELMKETLAWLPPHFDPTAFDCAAADASVRPHAGSSGRRVAPLFTNPDLVDLTGSMGARAVRVLGELLEPAWDLDVELGDAEIEFAVRPLTVLLDLVGDAGAELTSAGYLRPAVVRRLGVAIGIAEQWIGTVNREDLTPPIGQLRSAAQGLGLVRKHQGRLVLTPAGRRVRGHPTRLWSHLVETLPLGRRREQRHAGVLTLLCTAGRSDEPTFDQYAAGLLAAAGWAVRGEELSARQASEWARPTWEVLRSLRCHLPHRARDPAYLAVLSRQALGPQA